MERSKVNRSSFEKMSPRQQYDFIRNKQMTSCLLCIEGKRMRDQLADHFIVHHQDLRSKQYTSSCNCPEALKLQIKLLDHLLEHVMKKRKHQCKPIPKPSSRSKVVQEVITIDDEDEPMKEEEGNDENNSMDDYNGGDVNDNGNESEDYFTPLTKTIPSRKINNAQLTFPFKCNLCIKSFKMEEHLDIHMFTHNEKPQDPNLTQPVTCDFPDCGKVFISQTLLSNHKSQIHEKRMCEKCSDMVPSNRMKTHMRMKHAADMPPSGKNLKCSFPDCEAGFRTYASLRHHRITNHREKREFMCEFCSDIFPSEASLNNHRIRHTEPDKWRCEECKKTYTNKRSLDKHKQRVHEGIANAPRNFHCDQCPKTYIRARDLEDHIQKIHIEGKPVYKPKQKHHPVFCTICDKKISRKAHLVRHLRNIHKVIDQNEIEALVQGEEYLEIDPKEEFVE